MNTECFTGKAQAYAQARPGYPDEAIEFIRGLIKPDAVIADIGAGTGIFTLLLAQHGYRLYAVEPNADMREQLHFTLQSFPNATIVDGSAEATTLPDKSVDIVICAQALGWFDLNAFRSECRRIGKSNAIVISIHNEIPEENHIPENRLTNKKAAESYFNNPIAHEYKNPINYYWDRWFQYNASISDNPQPADTDYNVYIAELRADFEQKSVDGQICLDMVTAVYYERIEITE